MVISCDRAIFWRAQNGPGSKWTSKKSGPGRERQNGPEKKLHGVNHKENISLLIWIKTDLVDKNGLKMDPKMDPNESV